jgi:hypothetical protein
MLRRDADSDSQARLNVAFGPPRSSQTLRVAVAPPNAARTEICAKAETAESAEHC